MKKAANGIPLAAFKQGNGGGWLTTPELSIRTQEGMIGNER